MRVNVLETNVLHASDIVYWLDGSTADTIDKMQRVDRTLFVEFETFPKDLYRLQKAGRMALWRRPVGSIIDGMASEAERTRPVTDTYTLMGVVSDLQGKYNSRRFELSLGEGNGHAVVLYPTPEGTRFGKAGGLIGSLRFQTSLQPVPWALLELEVDTISSTMTFQAQADFKGDFLLSMSRVPPLPESVEHYSATLSVRASLTATAEQPVDPETLVEMKLGRIDKDKFKKDIEFNVKPGDIRLLRSFNEDHLTVKPD